MSTHSCSLGYLEALRLPSCGGFRSSASMVTCVARLADRALDETFILQGRCRIPVSLLYSALKPIGIMTRLHNSRLYAVQVSRAAHSSMYHSKDLMLPAEKADNAATADMFAIESRRRHCVDTHIGLEI